MIKKSIFSLLLLCTLMSPIQAEEAKQIIQSELTEQDRLGVVDDAIAFAAGYGGAYLTGLSACLSSRCMTSNLGINYLAVLGGVVFYGVISRKLAASEDQRDKMFSRGALVGTSVALAQLALPAVLSMAIN